MGLYKRRNIYWISFKNEKGIRERVSTETSNKKLADNIYAKVLTQVAEEKWFENSKSKFKTFDEMMERYISECSNKTSTIERKKGCLIHLKAAFSGKTISDITPEAISNYKLQRKVEGAADSTILNEIRMLSNAFNTAIRTWRWSKENPVSQVKLGLKPGKVDRWLTGDEERALLKASEGKMKGQLKEIIILGLNTGTSLGEIVNLRWQNIDLFRKTLISTREKTDVTRTIPLNQTALALLTEKVKVESISGYVFYNGANKMIDRWKLKASFNKAVTESKIKHFRFHDLRHTFATRMVQAGIDLYKVSKLLGHKDISTTQRYAHHYPESLRSGVDILDACHNSVTLHENATRDARSNVV